MTLAALGAFHGANPAMGWLFAVALALQEQRRGVMWRALVALGLGHAAAIGVAIAAGALVLEWTPGGVVRAAVAASLVGLGLRRLVRSRHPRAGGSMRSGFAGLAAWSFLIASAHGAGLMVLPFVLHGSSGASAHAAHEAAAATAADAAAVSAVTAVAVHTAAYAAATIGAAWIVHDKLGLGLLRRAWINVDAIWAIALIATGAAALFTL
jgi:hypothetical protein